ncbi:BCCT family transporter [Haliea sp.]|jgi:choline/glycine/proline betaine transport protein|uniref:BCCT family transporter n=1 Tax=Haliea TaxID=475794 RepID=UPI000C50C503|nr:BCCT family transporter [Haliea sp.]MAD64621.1 choline transporter [Haliea sp.]MAY93119.1 choline transporter [Haliea sp.]MBK39678.1 choline transporter [Haliea sp.]MBP69529.1 choline transporter [Haliea sp.]|tara:strand:- start:1139 stop:3109 length:1971 start_codon:yes stop_codon:yes gene_type:complete
MQSKKTRSGWSLDVDGAVFWPSLGLLAALVGVAAFLPQASSSLFQHLQDGIIRYASWYYVVVVAVILISIVVLSVTRLGDIKLGPDHSVPDYTLVSWFAMLFAAGMGIGLMFFGVAEPVMHFLQPPLGEGGTVEAARQAMQLTFFHWGLHAWGIYAIVALVLAYFAFRHSLPLTLRSAFYPLVGERIHGPFGAAVDVFAIICTSCGIATSLGYGVLQINGGLAYLVGIEISSGVQVGLICGIMVLAGISVALGLDAGIRRLSELNLLLALLLLGGVLFAGPTVTLLQSTIQSLGVYAGDLVAKTFNLYAYEPTDWLGGWTIFYWGWWLSWSPFVGLFIARISRGRTIREFVLGAMIVPCGFTLLWMGVFGNSAIELILHEGQVALGESVLASQAQALFQFLEYLPGSTLLSITSLLMVVVFFVTSADSGALVLNMLSAHGRDDTPVLQRLIWAFVIGTIAIVLLLAGGLAALQTAAIASALPFSLALLGAIWGLARALRLDVAQRDMQSVVPVVQGPDSWRERLNALLAQPGGAEVSRFQREIVAPALKQFADALQERGVSASIDLVDDEASRVGLTVAVEGEPEFRYEIVCQRHVATATGAEEAEPKTDTVFHRAEVHLYQGGQGYDVMGWSREQIIHDVLGHFERHQQFHRALH